MTVGNTYVSQTRKSRCCGSYKSQGATGQRLRTTREYAARGLLIAGAMKFLPLVILSLLAAARLHAVTFDFQFDGDPESGIDPNSTVGFGAFTFSNDPGLGTHAFRELGKFSLSFSFIDGSKFTEHDIVSDLDNVRVVLSSSGTGRRLQFSDTGSPAGGGGPLFTSFNLVNGELSVLGFEPAFVGGNLDTYFTGEIFGTYLATGPAAAVAGVPEPGSTVWLAGISMVALGAAARRLKRESASGPAAGV